MFLSFKIVTIWTFCSSVTTNLRIDLSLSFTSILGSPHIRAMESIRQPLGTSQRSSAWNSAYVREEKLWHEAQTKPNAKANVMLAADTGTRLYFLFWFISYWTSSFCPGRSHLAIISSFYKSALAKTLMRIRDRCPLRRKTRQSLLPCCFQSLYFGPADGFEQSPNPSHFELDLASIGSRSVSLALIYGLTPSQWSANCDSL